MHKLDVKLVARKECPASVAAAAHEAGAQAGQIGGALNQIPLRSLHLVGSCEMRSHLREEIEMHEDGPHDPQPRKSEEPQRTPQWSDQAKAEGEGPIETNVTPTPVDPNPITK